MKLTPPYGKSARAGQMRQRDAAMRCSRQALLSLAARNFE